MRKPLSIWLLSLCIISAALSPIACTKSKPAENKPTPEVPEKPTEEQEVILLQDITEKAKLSVNIENNNGATSAEGSQKLVDNNKTSKFLLQGYKPTLNIDFEFETARLLGSYEITSGNDFDGRDPMDWRFMGSNDGKTWTVLDRQWGEFFRKRSLTKGYFFKNQIKYKYYRLNVTAIYYGDVFQMAELRLIQMPTNTQMSLPITRVDSLKKDGLSLYFLNKSPEQTLAYKDRMMNTFFTVYPKLLNDFNPNARKSLYFIIDPSYEGAAYAISNVVVYSYDYMKANPNDIDIVTHEIMHHIQAYPGGVAPTWLSEGIADYVRYAYGVNNAAAGWSLPNYATSHSYKDSYRVTARFLAWIEKHVKTGFVKTADAAIRDRSYTEALWKSYTGKTVDELWQQYSENPTL